MPRSDAPSPGPPNADELRERFDAPAPPTVGLEEELMVLDAATLDLVPRAPELLARTGHDPRFTLEMPAAQLEIVVEPHATVDGAVAALAAGRRDLLAAAGDDLRLAAAGLHPFAAAEGPLNPGPRYAASEAEYGVIARRQLVFALQVHVAMRGADRALAVYNALRSHLPEIAALAAHAPFHDGRDTGLASWRPIVSQTLPRQGVPPALRSWDEYADALAVTAWGGGGRWWWELRPHDLHGTLELRVPDAQATVADAAAVAAFVQALVVALGERYDAGAPLPVHDTWRIEENRWSAARHGVEGELRDLDDGTLRPTRDVLGARLDELAPVAARLGCADELESARALVERNGAMRLREAAGPGEPDLLAATRSLVERFAP